MNQCKITLDLIVLWNAKNMIEGKRSLIVGEKNAHPCLIIYEMEIKFEHNISMKARNYIFISLTLYKINSTFSLTNFVTLNLNTITENPNYSCLY